MKTNPRAYSYVRFSSPKQEQGDSLRRQIADRDAYLLRHGLELDTSLCLQDLGVSAWKGKNAAVGALASFLDLCRQGSIPVGSRLILEKLDRLSRDEVHKALGIFMDILQAGVIVVTLGPEMEYTYETAKKGYGLILPLMQFAAANQYSEDLSDRLRKAWANKRRERKPLTKWTPCWLRLKEDRSGFELVPEKAEIVRKIVGLALDGYGDKRILNILNANLEEWPVVTGHPTWTNAFVAKLLKSPALIGQYEPGKWIDGKRRLTGEVWEDYFPAVITKAEWYRLRAAREERTIRGGPVGEGVANIFSGVLRNAKDGRPMQRIIKNHPRLISASFRDGHLDGDTQSFPYDAFEKAFLLMVAEYLSIGDLIGEDAKRPADEAATLAAELADVEERIRVLSEKALTAPDFASLADLIMQFEARKKAIQARLESARSTIIARASDEDTLADMKVLTMLLQDEAADKVAIRTKLKARMAEAIETIWLLVVGKKRSKFKTAVAQVMFKGGGEVAFNVDVVRERFQRVSPRVLMVAGEQFPPNEKMNLWDYADPIKGKAVRGLEAHIQRMMDDARKPTVDLEEV